MKIHTPYYYSIIYKKVHMVFKKFTILYFSGGQTPLFTFTVDKYRVWG